MTQIAPTINVPSSTWVIVEWRYLEGGFSRQPFPVFFASGMGGVEAGSVERIVQEHAIEQRDAGNDVHVAAYMLATGVEYPMDLETHILLDDEFYQKYPVEED